MTAITSVMDEYQVGMNEKRYMCTPIKVFAKNKLIPYHLWLIVEDLAQINRYEA